MYLIQDLILAFINSLLHIRKPWFDGNFFYIIMFSIYISQLYNNLLYGITKMYFMHITKMYYMLRTLSNMVHGYSILVTLNLYVFFRYKLIKKKKKNFLLS